MIDAVIDTLRELKRRVGTLEGIETPRTNYSTSFPVAWPVNVPFYRTDLGWWCASDGVRWLTCHEYSQQIIGWTQYGTNANLDAVLRTDYTPYVTRVAVVNYVVATNTGANYWSVNVQAVNGAKTVADGLRSFTTAANAPNTYISNEGIAATPEPTNRTYWRVSLAKTGAPGDLLIGVTVYHRLVVP